MAHGRRWLPRAPDSISARGLVLFALLILPLVGGAWIVHSARVHAEVERRVAAAGGLAPVQRPRERLAGEGGNYALGWALALSGVALSLVWFQRTIEQPLRDAGQELPLPGLPPEAAASINLPAELITLVRALQDARREALRWREEATQLRYSTDLRVEARTRRAEVARRSAQRAADTDALTGLANRRLLERELPRFVDACQRRGLPLALALFDLDDFKQLNDQFGHQAGDEVLRFTGELLRSTACPSPPICARIGGDEFVLVLPDTDLPRAAEITRQLCVLFDRGMVLHACSPKPRLSVGLSALVRGERPTWQELLRRADLAMYQSKRSRKQLAPADRPA